MTLCDVNALKTHRALLMSVCITAFKIIYFEQGLFARGGFCRRRGFVCTPLIQSLRRVHLNQVTDQLCGVISGVGGGGTSH